MSKTIDLKSAARSQDATRFAGAVRDRSTAEIGTDRFTASGDAKVPAPVRPTITAGDFTASGFGKDPRSS